MQYFISYRQKLILKIFTKLENYKKQRFKQALKD